MYRPQEILSDLESLLAVRSPLKFYFYCIPVGVISGFIALGFVYIIDIAEAFTFGELAGVSLGEQASEFTRIAAPERPATGPIVFFLLPIFGGFLSGLIEFFLDKKSQGRSTGVVIDTFHRKDGISKWQTPISKFLATVSTLASGGSAGREGPLAIIGASTAGVIAKVLKLGPKAGRSLYLAGMAGTLGAVFQAPLGAALLTVEVLYKDDFESESLIPCIISSIVGYFVFTSFSGFESLFSLGDYHFQDWSELIFYSVLALLCFGFGYLFVRLRHKIGAIFSSIPIAPYFKPALGGLVIAMLALLSLETVGTGFGFLQSLMNGSTPQQVSLLGPETFKSFGMSTFAGLILFLFLLVLVKIVATSVTVGSGASGGIFGPSLFIGGMLGAIVGYIGHEFFPGIVETPIPYIVVGMGGFLTGVINTPIGALIIVCELTGSYELLPAMMTVSVLSLVFSAKFSIYREQYLNRFQSPAHAWEMTNDYLRELRIQEAMDPNRQAAVLDRNVPVKELYNISHETHETDFIIADSETQTYLGILSLRHIYDESGNDFRDSTNSVEALIEEVVPPLHRKDSVTQGLQKILNWDLDKIPVVNKDGKLVGYLTFRDILEAYRQSVIRHKR